MFASVFVIKNSFVLLEINEGSCNKWEFIAIDMDGTLLNSKNNY